MKIALGSPPLRQLFAYNKNVQNPCLIRVFGTLEDPLFPSNEICWALELESEVYALGKIDKDDLCVTEVIDSSGRPQKIRCLTESGLYTLMLRCNRPRAKAFRKWVKTEVLPSIRRATQLSLLSN
jgi:prophage antirepressor-like protein